MIMDKAIGNITSYCKLETDNDNNEYYFIKSEVYPYKSHNSQINELISYYSKLSNEEGNLFIKRNYLFFKLGEAKFYVKISHFNGEWKYIHQIISSFSEIAEDVSYIFGELD